MSEERLRRLKMRTTGVFQNIRHAHFPLGRSSYDPYDPRKIRRETLERLRAAPPGEWVELPWPKRQYPTAVCRVLDHLVAVGRIEEKEYHYPPIGYQRKPKDFALENSKTKYWDPAESTFGKYNEKGKHLYNGTFDVYRLNLSNPKNQ